MDVLQSSPKSGNMMTVRDGFLICPVCRQNRRLLRISPETEAVNLSVFCRRCKAEIKVDIVKGQCYESRSQ